jgi:hypothetical protein
MAITADECRYLLGQSVKYKALAARNFQSKKGGNSVLAEPWNYKH